MAVERVQLIQKNLDKLVENITDTQIRLGAENVKRELQGILSRETEGTGQLAQSIQVQRGRQRGKPIIRILSARHGLYLFRGTQAPYDGTPPSAASAFRFGVWATSHGFRPRRLARIIALGQSRGKVYSDRSNMLIRALRNGFRI